MANSKKFSWSWLAILAVLVLLVLLLRNTAKEATAPSDNSALSPDDSLGVLEQELQATDLGDLEKKLQSTEADFNSL